MNNHTPGHFFLKAIYCTSHSSSHWENFFCWCLSLSVMPLLSTSAWCLYPCKIIIKAGPHCLFLFQHIPWDNRYLLGSRLHATKTIQVFGHIFSCNLLMLSRLAWVLACVYNFHFMMKFLDAQPTFEFVGQIIFTLW